MSLLLNRLTAIGDLYDVNVKQFVELNDFIETISPEKLKSYSKHIAALKLDYRLILNCLHRNNALQEEVKLEKQRKIILGALWLNALLIHIRLKTHNVNSKIKTLLIQRRHLLQTIHPDPKEKENTPYTTTYATHIHSIYATINPFRDLIIRGIRAFQASGSLVQAHTRWVQSLQAFNRIANPILAHLAWIFFIPRFLVNCALLCRHLLLSACMNEKEQALTQQARIYLIRKNALTLMNDFVSIVSSLTNCFILTGKLNPFALYVTGATFVIDVIVAVITCIHICHRLKTLKKNYSDQEKPDAAFNQAIEKMIAYKKRKCFIQIANTSSIVLFFILTLPVLGLAPIVPMIAQCALFIIVIANWAAQKINAKTNPKRHNPAYITQRFFNQKTLSNTEKNDILRENDMSVDYLNN